MGHKKTLKSKRKRATTPYKPTEEKPKEPKSKFRVFCRRAWNVISVAAIICSVWLSYFSLPPKVEVVYNSFFLPEDEGALPIRIKNNSIFSIYDVKLDGLKKITTNRHNLGSNMKFSDNIASEIESNVYMDHTISLYRIAGKPMSGDIKLTVNFDYSIFSIPFSKTQTFNLVQDKNSNIRWLSE